MIRSRVTLARIEAAATQGHRVALPHGQDGTAEAPDGEAVGQREPGRTAQAGQGPAHAPDVAHLQP